MALGLHPFVRYCWQSESPVCCFCQKTEKVRGGSKTEERKKGKAES